MKRTRAYGGSHFPSPSLRRHDDNRVYYTITISCGLFLVRNRASYFPHNRGPSIESVSHGGVLQMPSVLCLVLVVPILRWPGQYRSTVRNKPNPRP
ncbi:hypothetical protein V8E53_007552 [Lactarius tabidus]